MNDELRSDFSGVRAVTFDAAQTLFHPIPSVGAIYREVMARHDLHYAEAALEAGFRRAFATAVKDPAILDGEARERSYWVQVVKCSIEGLSPQPDDFETLFDALWSEFAHGHRWQLAEGGRETLETLRERGYKIALLTNWDSRVRQVLAEKGLSGHFDAVIVSSEVGAEKPDPEIFAAAEDALGCAPREILHVGDSLQHDIRGALAADWRAVRIIGSQDAASDESRNIRRLGELLAILPERAG